MLANVKAYFSHDEKKVRDNRWIFLSMLVGALLSLLAAFMLSVEAIELAKNPSSDLPCNVNVILNCATVNNHPTGKLFGFPNSFIGMIAEPIVITVAIAGLAGVRFPRLFMRTAQIFYSLGLVFALYLLYASMFIIGALCPWCLLVTLMTIMVWFALTRYNLRENNLGLSKAAQKKVHAWLDKDYDKLLMAVIIFVIVTAILIKYGNGLFA